MIQKEIRAQIQTKTKLVIDLMLFSAFLITMLKSFRRRKVVPVRAE